MKDDFFTKPEPKELEPLDFRELLRVGIGCTIGFFVVVLMLVMGDIGLSLLILPMAFIGFPIFMGVLIKSHSLGLPSKFGVPLFSLFISLLIPIFYWFALLLLVSRLRSNQARRLVFAAGLLIYLVVSAVLGMYAVLASIPFD